MGMLMSRTNNPGIWRKYFSEYKINRKNQRIYVIIDKRHYRDCAEEGEAIQKGR